MLEEKGAMAYTIIVAANASDPAPMQVYSSQVQQLENILEIQVVQL
jgi:F0F1-type ATP synthase alpha subunit